MSNASPLRLPRFRRYFTGQALSTFGDSVVPLTLAWAVFEATGSVVALGVVLAASRVPVAVLLLVGGAVADRWPRWRVMICADVLRVGTQAATGVLLLTGAADVWSLAVLQALAGAGSAMFTPAAAGLVPELVGESELQSANALLGLAANVNKVTAISIAGVLVSTVGPGWAMAIDAATFAGSAAALASIRSPAGGHRAGSVRPALLSAIGEGWRVVVSTTWLRTMVAYTALLQLLVIGPHMVLGPVIAERELGGAAAWAAIGVAQAIGSIFGGVVALRVRPRRPVRVGLLSSLLMVPYLALLAAGAPVWLIAAAAVGVGAQGSFWIAVSASAVQTHVPRRMVSRVAAYNQLGSAGLIPVALAFTGAVASAVGDQVVVGVCAVWVLVSTVVAASVPAVRALPGRAHPAVVRYDGSADLAVSGRTSPGVAGSSVSIARRGA